MALLKQYFQTGRFEPLSRLVNCSIERLEFYSDLRKINDEINKMNGAPGSGQRIVFNIIGAEPPDDYQGTYTKMSLEEGFKWFVDERDKLSSNKIIDYCRKNPSQKMLIFYGTAHLNRKWADKNAYYPQLGPQYGYYMAHYLSEAFGDGEILTVNQEFLPDKGSTRLSVICDRLVKPKEVKNIYFQKNFVHDLITSLFTTRSYTYDATILRREILVPPHRLGAVISKAVVEACIKRLQLLEGHKGFLAKSEYDSINGYLAFSTGKEFRTAGEWNAWWISGAHDTAARLATGEFIDEMIKDARIRNKISELTGPRPTATSSDECLLISERFKTLNCIGIIFAGDASEKTQAMEYLNKQIPRNFSDGADYMKFWRKNAYKVDY